MVNYKFIQKVKVVSTDNLGQTLLDILKAEKYYKPLFVMDGFLVNNPIVKKAETLLKENGINFSIFDQIVSDPPMEIVDDGVEAFKHHEADSIIAIGGGSSIDVARGINIVRINGGKIADYIDENKDIADCPGLISVPTTSGTGSEMSNALVVTNSESKQKIAILADAAVSEYTILNPELVMTLPKNMTIATGLDAFSHAAEGYLSKLSTPITDAICEKVMFLLYNYLPVAVQDGENREARERVMIAASLAGWMLNNAGTNIGHSSAHILGSKYHIIHGEAVAYALPGVMELTNTTMPNKIKEIGQILNAEYKQDASQEEIKDIAVKAYKNFRDNTLGLHSFNDYEIERKELIKNTDEILNERFATNTPGDLNHDKVEIFLSGFGMQ